MTTTSGVPRIEQATTSDLARLDEIMNVDVPRLRSAVAPLLKIDKILVNDDNNDDDNDKFSER